MKKFLLFVTLLTAWNFSIASASPIGRNDSKRPVINSRLAGTSSSFRAVTPKTNAKTPYLINEISPEVRTTNVTTNSDGTINVPFLYSPTKEDFNLFTVIDNNDDGKTWTYEKKKKALMYRYSVKNHADEFVILPPIKITYTY